MIKWSYYPLEELAAPEPNSFVDGPFGSSLKADEYIDAGVPIIRLQNIRPNRYIPKQIKYISEKKARELSRHSYRPGDLVIAKLGDPCGMACVLPLEAGEGRIVADVVRFRGNEKLINHRYLSYYINSPFGRMLIDKDAKGATRQRVNLSSFKRLSVPTPSLPEQHRIVAILDQADALRTKRRETLAQLDNLAQSIFIEMFGDPVSNPKRWRVCTVGDVSECIVPGRDKPKSFSGDIPWITTDDLIHLGFTSYSPKGFGLSMDEITQVKARVIPAGSVIISCVGNLGVSTIAEVDMVINQQLHSFQCHDDIENVYLMYCLAAQTAYMYSMASSTTLPYMNKSVCNGIPIQVPPKPLQRQFSERVRVIVEKKRMHNASLLELNGLFASLQHRAFHGEF